jgi:hypothetical protein
MPSPARLAAEAVASVIDAEFVVEGIVAEHDKIHESLGHLGPRVAIYPDSEGPAIEDANQQITDLTVQFFGKYDRQIDPEQRVDPRAIVDLAHRFRMAFYTYERANPGTDDVWFMHVLDIRYPDDPTGNKTRFVARIRCYGTNAALIEVQP